MYMGLSRSFDQTDAQSPAAYTSGTEVFMEASVTSAPFPSFSMPSDRKRVFGDTPIERITTSAA